MHMKYALDAQRTPDEQTLERHQIKFNKDHTDSSDILQYFVPAITFIQAELDKDHGVLVHCQTDISEFGSMVVRSLGDNLVLGRSASIVAAYLMVSQGLDPAGALEAIRRVRPDVQYVYISPSLALATNGTAHGIAL